jgi:peptidoglycan hydrolase-like amidase
MQNVGKILFIFTLALLFMSMTGAATYPLQKTGSTNSEVAISAMPNQPTTVPAIPNTIRVLRYRTGVIETVDFKDYCRCCTSMEWGIPSFSQDVLKVGAMAVKSFGMYAIAHPKYGGAYDVTDTTMDQVYAPGEEVSYTDAAVNSTWDYVISRNGSLIDIGWNDNILEGNGNFYTTTVEDLSAQGKDWQYIIHYDCDPVDIQSVKNVSSPVPLTSVKPMAVIGANTTNGIAPLTIQFKDLSTNETLGRIWKFGDGISSTDINPIHTYKTAGSYTVTLTANNKNGSVSTTKKIIVKSYKWTFQVMKLILP